MATKLMYDAVSGKLIRILSIRDASVLVINCLDNLMPEFMDEVELKSYREVDLPFLNEKRGGGFRPLDQLKPVDRQLAMNRYVMIAGALTVIDNKNERNRIIEVAAETNDVSKQTIRNYLKQYLIYQDIGALAPKEEIRETELTETQKTMRWALNKFYYTQHKNSLNEAYTMMLKEKYTSAGGVLLQHPSFWQFRHFYRVTKKIEKERISREGLKAYQRNYRPLLGDGVQSFAPSIGTAMLDGTICDIYLVDNEGRLVGRPVLVAGVDANTSLCLGYTLLWEGGTYSLQRLMINMIEDKVALCKRMGIEITEDQWPNRDLPGVMVTDAGSEYKGQTFEQIAELGVTLINLQSFRPDLKGPIEKLFDLVQDSYKAALKGKGVIMPDFQERGAHDYRKDAVLTIDEFERIVVRCIAFYNSERVVKSYPYTKEMIDDQVPPHASDLWNYKIKQPGATLIPVTPKELMLTLFPRIQGTFSRYGLKVNGLRYHREGFKEQYLKGGTCEVAYNPDNCSNVWLKEKDGSFLLFDLIEQRFIDKTLYEAKHDLKEQKEILTCALDQEYAAKVSLLQFMDAIAAPKTCNIPDKKNIRNTRRSSRNKKHIDLEEIVNG